MACSGNSTQFRLCSTQDCPSKYTFVALFVVVAMEPLCIPIVLRGAIISLPFLNNLVRTKMWEKLLSSKNIN